MHMQGASRGYLSMSESVTLLPPPKDVKIGVGAAFIKVRGVHVAFRAAPNTNLIANNNSEEEEEWSAGATLVMVPGQQAGNDRLFWPD